MAVVVHFVSGKNRNRLFSPFQLYTLFVGLIVLEIRFFSAAARLGVRYIETASYVPRRHCVYCSGAFHHPRGAGTHTRCNFGKPARHISVSVHSVSCEIWIDSRVVMRATEPARVLQEILLDSLSLDTLVFR